MELDLAHLFSKRERLFLIVAALIILVSYFIFPLLEGLVLGVVFAYVGRPVRNLFGERRQVGSLVATICIIIPLSAIFALGTIEIVGQIKWLANHQTDIITATYDFIYRFHVPQLIFEEVSRSMQNLIDMSLPFLASLPFFSLGKAITLGIFNFLISLGVCYFLLYDGSRLKEAVMAFLSTKNDDFTTRCLTRIDAMLNGIYVGSIYTAIAGGIASVAIFYFFGVPRPFAMASIVFLAGMVPFLTWLVFIPMAISRYIEYGPADAITFFLAGSILVHAAELIIRPYIVYSQSSLHPLLVLLTFLGGGLVAGIPGFFLAPAMAGVLISIYQIIKEEKKNANATKENKENMLVV